MNGKFVAFESETFYKLIDEIVIRVTQKVKPSKEVDKKRWVSSSEAKTLLGIKSDGKLRQLVNSKNVSASQHGRTILYCRQSILRFLEESKIS